MDGLQLGQVCINGFADIIKSVETKKGLSDQCGRIKVRKRRFQDLLQCFSQQYQIPISRFTYPIELVLVHIASIEENLPGFDSASLLHAKLGRRIFTFAVASTTINAFNPVQFLKSLKLPNFCFPFQILLSFHVCTWDAQRSSKMQLIFVEIL